MKTETRTLLLAAAVTLLISHATGQKSNEVIDENIKNHRINGPGVARPVYRKPISTTVQPPIQTLPFKPSEVDDSPFIQPEPKQNAALQQQRPQIQPIPAQTQNKPIFARSLGESGLGYGYGGSGNSPCTTCNSIQSQFGYNPNSCCTYGFSRCCYVGIQPIIDQHQYKPYYPITTLTPSLYNSYGSPGIGTGYHSNSQYNYPTQSPWSKYKHQSPNYNQYRGISGGAIGYNLWKPGGGRGFGGNIGKHGYNNVEKPGTCYRPGGQFGGQFGSGYSGYNNGANNAGYYFQRSDTNVDVDGRVKREVYPSQNFGSGSGGSNYGAPVPYSQSSYSSGYGGNGGGGGFGGNTGFGGGFGNTGGGFGGNTGGGYGGNTGGGYGGGGHGGIIYPTTQRPSYCRRDYDCPGNKKCCSGYCSTPSFVG